MRPLRLKIHGLTSFQGGAGDRLLRLDLLSSPVRPVRKTSVLDAVALALYGEVPRTGKRNASDLVTMVIRARGSTSNFRRTTELTELCGCCAKRRASGDVGTVVGDDWAPRCWKAVSGRSTHASSR